MQQNIIDKRIAAHAKMPDRGYLEPWEFADIVNTIFDDIGTCASCAFYINGFCHEKISEKDAENETEREDLEKYFKRIHSDYCSFHKSKDIEDEEDN